MSDEPDLETQGLPLATEPGPTVHLEEGSLLVVEGPDRGRRFLFAPPRIRIGTKDDNDVVLTDTTVSKHHVIIEERGGGIVLCDLGSRNGTSVGGTRIKEAFLDPGATIRLGRTALVFQPPGQGVSVEASPRTSFGGVLGASPPMRAVFGLLDKVAATDLGILVYGETGTGKELVAHAIHQASARSAGPYVVFDGSAIARELVESTLFGHKEGAFTGASARRKGAFQSAHGGTLFIDEIGELPLDIQPKLLRVLEKREVQPLGADQPVKVDVRVIAATHRDLRAMVADGQFRQDLFYRLSVVEVTLPALRERSEDIPLIAEQLLASSGAKSAGIAAAAIQALRGAAWPGNVRELRNVLERAAVLAAPGPIEVAHLSLPPAAKTGAKNGAASDPGVQGDRSLSDVEAEAILATLRKAGWNKSKAARILGITRNTLQDKINRYNLKP